ncbi:MAG: redox-regulated ATPase YchF [Christensenellaceae bacterium]|nr:redox-regulated ATPase YchF [Christensenellaceae bacterium]
MKLGVVGLPNVGKSTLFNAITKAGAQAANYPFCTIEPNTGIVLVPDIRVDKLSAMYNPKKTTYATVEFVDIAGLVKGASKGEGLGNKFLSHIREVDAIVHVVRCFDDDNIIHVEGSIDPKRDIETINLELILADLETVAKRKTKASKLLKVGEKEHALDFELCEIVEAHLEKGLPVRTLKINDEQRELIKSWFLLSSKPVIYAINIAEEDLGKDYSTNNYIKIVKEIAASENSQTLIISAQIEEEVSTLPNDEKQEFLNELGIGESGLDRLVKASYDLLGLISFLTTGTDECRAWTIKKGTKAPQAAGKIHSDFERGFIRAEVVPFDVLYKNGSIAVCKEKGLVKSEGKEYVVNDGDVILFRFNV